MYYVNGHSPVIDSHYVVQMDIPGNHDLAYIRLLIIHQHLSKHNPRLASVYKNLWCVF